MTRCDSRNFLPQRRGARNAAWLVALFLATFAAPTSPAMAEDAAVREAFAKSRKETGERLAAVMDWAKGKRIDGFRHRAATLVVSFDEGHPIARYVLGWRRSGPTFPWQRDAVPAEPADFNEARRQEGERRVALALQPYRDAVMAAYEEGSNLEPAVMDAALGEIAALLPDDAAIQQALGRVSHGGKWVLPETVRGIEFRAEQAAWLREARKRVVGAIRRDAIGLAEGWAAAYESPNWLFLGTGLDHDLKDSLIYTELAHEWYTQAVAAGPRKSHRRTTILLESEAEALSVAKMRNDSDALHRIPQVGGLTLKTGEELAWFRNPAVRNRATMRAVLSQALHALVQGSARAWVIEGAGQRLTAALSGDLGPYFVEIGDTTSHVAGEAPPLEIPREAAYWPATAVKLLEGEEGVQRMVRLLTAQFNAMNRADAVVAYGLGAYLMEGRPEKFVPFATASTTQHDGAALIREHFGVGVGEFNRRLQQWLRELPPR